MKLQRNEQKSYNPFYRWERQKLLQHNSTCKKFKRALLKRVKNNLTNSEKEGQRVKNQETTFERHIGKVKTS